MLNSHSNIIIRIGNILLAADDIGVTGLWFEGQKYFPNYSDEKYEEKEITLLRNAKQWLDIYFSGKKPNVKIPVHLIGTNFQIKVWQILCAIPYGEIISYGEIAKQIAEKNKTKKMSAQAVGMAIGRNKISIIVPCHRVIGKNGELRGYAGGIEKKLKLLKLERVELKKLFIPV